MQDKKFDCQTFYLAVNQLFTKWGVIFNIYENEKFDPLMFLPILTTESGKLQLLSPLWFVATMKKRPLKYKRSRL